MIHLVIFVDSVWFVSISGFFSDFLKRLYIDLFLVLLLLFNSCKHGSFISI